MFLYKEAYTQGKRKRTVMLARAIYGVESCLSSAPCSRELRTVASPLSSVANTCTTGHTTAHHHGRSIPIPIPTRGSLIISTNHRLFTLDHTAMTRVNVSPKLLHWTRFTSSSTFPVCHRLSTVSVCRKSGWICQHASSLCQQWRTYAKKAKRSVQKLSENDQDVINLDKVESAMEAAINSLKYEYTNSIITRITPASLDKITVEIDGESFQLKQVGQLGMPNPQTIIINMASYPQAVNSVVAALRDSDLNLNPIPEKNIIKVPIPKMTKEFRESLVKVAKASAEKCKVGVRKARQKAMADLKKKTDVSKDSIKRLEKHIQELTDKHTGRIEEMFKAKSAELLKGS